MQEKFEQPMQAPAGHLSAELLAAMTNSEVMIFISFDGSAMTVRGMLKGDDYKPETVATHAYLAAVYAEHVQLMDIVNGNITDADRYRALRDFAALAGSNPERFETINVALQDFEETNGLAGDDTKRTEADFTKIADFLALALLETAEPGPVVQAGTDTQQ